eukprot:gene12638-12730_t
MSLNDRLLTTREAAAELKLQPNTLAKWRVSGEGLMFVRVGRALRYRPIDLATFVQAGIRKFPRFKPPHFASGPSLSLSFGPSQQVSSGAAVLNSGASRPFQYIIRDTKKHLGFPVNPHMFRNGTATSAGQLGTTKGLGSSLLQHSSSKMTDHYNKEVLQLFERSLPRMCGTRQIATETRRQLRFIPTHVGNTYKAQQGGSWGKGRFIPTHVGNTRHFQLQLTRPTVHPHACGEHMCGLFPNRIFDGSSPRMWGTRRLFLRGLSYERFIPTHVGNTNQCVLLWRVETVHPHACGEHIIRLWHIRHASGSSPRMWGTPRLKQRRIAVGRFIPTHNNGSSPRMWGTLGQFSMKFSKGRFIPTHVGNTATEFELRMFMPVHPHACGEHGLVCAIVGGLTGSSPRMWGTQSRGRGARGLTRTDRRFIPTHVGNTTTYLRVSELISVHPHACLLRRFIPTHSGDRFIPTHIDGSSPRMWGTRITTFWMISETRFIPTHVGNTRWPHGPSRQHPVHPHACGSSPRMWGTPRGMLSHSLRSRFIPTHVGNTTSESVM